jgi:ornithine carbamoyltransferase
VRPGQVREHAPDDLPRLLRELVDTLELRAQERLELRREVDHASAPRINAIGFRSKPLSMRGVA